MKPGIFEVVARIEIDPDNPHFCGDCRFVRRVWCVADCVCDLFGSPLRYPLTHARGPRRCRKCRRAELQPSTTRTGGGG